MPTNVHHQTQAKITSVMLFMLVMLTSRVSAASLSRTSSLPVPNLSLQPADVVRIIITALANNDDPYTDAGSETTFNFASAANKSTPGPLDRFISMVKSPVFAVMLNHQQSEFSSLVLQKERAFQLLRLINNHDVKVHFAFRLGRQTQGEFKGMWMTEAVWPLDIPLQGIEV